MLVPVTSLTRSKVSLGHDQLTTQYNALFLRLRLVYPGLDARGDSNIFRYNTCVKNLGAGVRIGGHNIDGKQYGENNEVYGNILQDNEYGGIKITVRASTMAWVSGFTRRKH